jgi:predicted unusual protein kinase regulating ubiquinone biosynthesis (AarF/ABC1/UbiB family)
MRYQRRKKNYCRLLIGLDKKDYERLCALSFALSQSVSKICADIINRSMRRRLAK